MSEIEARPARSGSPLPLVGIGVLLLVGIAVLAYFKGGSGIPGLSGSAIKQVGSLDQEAVFTMPEFEKRVVRYFKFFFEEMVEDIKV